MLYVLFILLLLSWFIYVKLKLKKPSLLALIFKVSTTSLIIIYALVAIRYNLNVISLGLIVVMSLIFGLLGDIFLDLKLIYKSDDLFYTYAGFYSFIFGHVLYGIYFLLQYRLGYIEILCLIVASLLFTVLVLLTEKPTKLNYGKFRPIVCAYAFILSFVTLLVFWVALSNKQSSLLIFGYGMLAFIVSDLILSQSYFGEQEKKWMIISNYIFYYGAQFLIAFALVN
jgi:hypothetical protein